MRSCEHVQPFPPICSLAAAQVDVAKFPPLDWLEFSDEIGGTIETVDILLQAYNYYKVVSGKIIKGDTGPTAFASKFGW